MPHAPASPQNTDALAEYRTAWKATMMLLRAGHSFSGHERNCAMLNCRGPKFANVSAVSGLDFDDDGRAIGATDWDQDGDLDLWITNRTGPRLRLMVNQTTDLSALDEHRFVAFRLQGTRSNRDAIGARVTVDLADTADDAAEGRSNPRLMQTLAAGDAYLSQSSKWLHFGLGSSAIAAVEVRWPDGTVESFPGIAAGRRYLLVEGSGRAVEVPARARPTGLSARAQPEFHSPPTMQTWLSNRLPMPVLRYQPLDDAATSVRIEPNGQPLLLIFWASWCPPCVEELAELSQAQHAQSLRDAGIQVLALSVDGLDASQPTGADDARRLLEQLKFPFAAGIATRELLDKLDVAQGLLINYPPNLAVPTSYLFDADGELAAIYRGPVDAEQLLADLPLLDASPAERRDRAVPMPGRWLSPPRELLMRAVARAFREQGYDEDYARYLELDTITLERRRQRARSEAERAETDRRFASASFDLGLALASAGDLVEAQAHFERVIEVDPQHVGALSNLGALLARSGRADEALEFLQRAVDADPDSLTARSNLAAALTSLGRATEAVGHYRAMLADDADQAPVHSQLARALLEAGDLESASEHLARAVQLNPHDFAASVSLAWLRATSPHEHLRDGEEALQLATRMHQATGGRNALVIDVLAAAHAELGDFAAAIATLEQALPHLTPRQVNTRRVWQMRLAQYRQHRPCRDDDGRYP